MALVQKKQNLLRPKRVVSNINSLTKAELIALSKKNKLTINSQIQKQKY